MRIFRFNEIDSTNKYLKEREDLKDYDCVIAKTQTAGVGVVEMYGYPMREWQFFHCSSRR